MIGEIIKVQQLLKSRNGNYFRRVEFRLEDKTWAKTDLCPDYRNYKRWQKFLKVGTWVGGLILKDKNTIDADSFPRKADPTPKMDIESMSKMGIFG